MDEVIRDARESEAEFLSELAVRSKGHWGYDEDFLDDCRDELTLTPELISHSHVRVLEEEGHVIGFYSLVATGDDAEVDHFWVEPSAVGRGSGQLLWNDAVETATRTRFKRLIIHSDPHAEGFYLRMGASRLGDIASPVRPGRYLPLLQFELG